MKRIFYLLAFLSVFSLGACKDDDEPQKVEYKPYSSTEDNKPNTTDPQNNTNTETTLNVFLCFGQSNMEGNAAVEDVDRNNVPSGMKNMIVANCDVTNYSAARYSWRKANPPLARFNTGLTPADYFGRTMLENLPSGQEIGIVMVAIGGADIEAFEKDRCEAYCGRTDFDGWYKNYLAEYDNNPYLTLVTAAKEAQKSGVIRGILLHQGETNNCQQDWPKRVKKIYEDLLTDLNLTAEDCPLLAGEMLHKENNGICYGHNEVIATLPNVIPTAHVISSEGCEGNGVDGFHFCTEGYRIIGKRYAQTMLKLMGVDITE